MRRRTAPGAALVLLSAASAHAESSSAGKLDVEIPGVGPGARVPRRFVLCRATSPGHATFGADPGPAGTQSCAAAMRDLDLPADISTANQDGICIADQAPGTLPSQDCERQ